MLVLDWSRKDLDITVDVRVMGLLYHLGIADSDDLRKITRLLFGWDAVKLHNAIRWARDRANRQGTSPKEKRERLNERDQWVRIQKTKKDGPNVYSLGRKGFQYILEYLGEPVGNRRPPSTQVRHFKGINQILIRLLERGERPVWYSTREATSWMINSLKRRDVIYDAANDRYIIQSKRSQWTINPDALVQFEDGRTFVLEYETGTTRGIKQEQKFMGYLDLALEENVQIPPVVFVAPESNVEKLERAMERAMSREEYREMTGSVEFFVFEEGSETEFLLSGEMPEKEEEVQEVRIQPLPRPEWIQPDEGTEELERLRREKEELEKKLKKQKEDMDYWVEKSRELNRLLKEQQEWIERLDQYLGSKLLARGAYEDFLKKHPKPRI